MEKLSELFGQAIRKLRKNTGITQEVLAQKAHIDRTYMSSIERGKKNPTIKVIYKISQGLGISVSDIINEFEGNIHDGNAPDNSKTS